MEIYIGGKADTPDQLALQIAPPTVVLDEGNTIRHLLPNEARLRNITYAAQVSADILIRVHFTTKSAEGTFVTTIKDAPILRAFNLFKLPILLRPLPGRE